MIIYKLKLSQKIWKAKSAMKRSLLNGVPCVPAFSTCLCANIPKACQHFIFMCQCANKRANMPKAYQFFNLACQTHTNFQTGVPTCQKVCQFSNHFSKENIFQFLIFSIMANICKFQKYSGNSRKFILRNQEFKFWHLLVSPYML